MAIKTFKIPISNLSQFGDKSNTINEFGDNGISSIKITNTTQSSMNIDIFAGTTPDKDTFLLLYKGEPKTLIETNDDADSNSSESLCSQIYLGVGETIYAWCTLYNSSSGPVNCTVDFEIRGLNNETDVDIEPFAHLPEIRLEPELLLEKINGKMATLRLKDNSSNILLNYNVYVESDNQPKTLIQTFDNNYQIINKLIECGIGLKSCFLQNNKHYKFTVECTGTTDPTTYTRYIEFDIDNEEPEMDIQPAKLFLDNSELKTKIKLSFDLNDIKNLLTETKIQIIDNDGLEVFNETVRFEPGSFSDKTLSISSIYPLNFNSVNFTKNGDIIEAYVDIDKTKTYSVIKNSKDIKYETTENDVITNFNLIEYGINTFENFYEANEIKNIEISNVVVDKTAKILNLITEYNKDIEKYFGNFEIYFEFLINSKSVYFGKNNFLNTIVASNLSHNIVCKILLSSDKINYKEISAKNFVENMHELANPSLIIKNEKSYINVLEYSELFNGIKEPNILFDIYRSEVEKNENGLEEVEDEMLIGFDNTENTFVDKKTKSGKIYQYRVKSKDKDNPFEEHYSDFVRIKNQEFYNEFIDNNIKEKTKYFYKIVSVKNKYN